MHFLLVYSVINFESINKKCLIQIKLTFFFVFSMFGYLGVYIICGCLEFFCLLYVIFFLKEINQEQIDNENKNFFTFLIKTPKKFTDNLNVIFNMDRDKYAQRFLRLTLIALFIEFICFTGYLKKKK